MFEAIKRAGFDSVLISLSGEFDNEKQIDIIHKVGLEIDNCHSPWDNINHLWKDTLKGESAFLMLRDNLIECGKFGVPRAVWHVSAGNGYPPISQLGIDRVAKLIEVAERANVDICLENQRFFHFIDYIYAKLDCPRLKFCYDSGHESCFSLTKLALPKYRHKLAALHLHDNSGIYNSDDHLLPGRGTGVDWDYVRKNIADYNGVISLEVKRIPELSLDEFYTQAFEAAKFVKS
jgi:sugar phosphate isomerase/epimerase